MKSTDEWDSILDPNEKIVWQGRPSPKFKLKPFQLFEAIFGLFFSCFALFWMIMAARTGGVFWMFGLLHFSVGIGVVFHALFWASFKRKRTWYTLSDRRAFIGTDLPIKGKNLKTYPINQDTHLELEAGSLASVYFATSVKPRFGSNSPAQIGFERIPDGAEVFRKLRDIQLRDAGRNGDT